MQMGKARLVYNWPASSHCRDTALGLVSPCLSLSRPILNWAECLLTWSHPYAALCILKPWFLLLHFQLIPQRTEKVHICPFSPPSFKHLDPALSPKHWSTWWLSPVNSTSFTSLRPVPLLAISTAPATSSVQILSFTMTIKTISQFTALPSVLTQFQSILSSSDIFIKYKTHHAWNSPLSIEWSANSLARMTRPPWSCHWLFSFVISYCLFFTTSLPPTLSHIQLLAFHTSRPSHIFFPLPGMLA